MRVSRQTFLDQLWEQSKHSSVVVTGSPGVGKSWILAQFMRRCKVESRPYLPIVAEDFAIQSTSELHKALGFTVELPDMLAQLGEGAVLVIDGLDALRGEASQRPFRDLIRSVVKKVHQAKVLVSIRNFDLQESVELQNLLFGERRHFARLDVPEFTEQETQGIAAQIPELRPLLLNPALPIGTLLRNAFNVTLATQLVQSGVLETELSALRSQTHLMDAWWRRRIDDTSDALDKRQLLRRLCSAIVSSRSMTVPETEMYVPGTSQALNVLQSAEVIRKGATERFGFTHNILFDYAAGRLLLDETTVLAFVLQDATNSIFFRPSINVLFNRLWIHDRTLFWNTAALFFASSIPERARIVPAICIFENAKSIADLQPLTNTREPWSDKGVASVLRAVQSFGGVRQNLWTEWIVSLRGSLSLTYINEYVALLGNIAEGATEPFRTAIAAAARELVRWMWSKAEAEERSGTALQLADIAAGKVLPVALRFYATDVRATRSLVFDLLARLGRANASGNEPFWLAQHIEHVFEVDKATATKVFERIFGYNETSNEKRAMGSGSILALTTTKKQQVDVAKHAFQRQFAALADHAPVDALALAIAAVNAEVRTRKPPRPRRSQAFAFVYHGHQVKYHSDVSEVWDTSYRDVVSLELLRGSLERLRLRVDSIEVIARRLAKARYAVVWKNLIEVASNHPTEMLPLVLPLLIDSRLLAAPETTNAAGRFIAQAYKSDLFDRQAQIAIEAAIEGIPDAELIERYERPESIRDRLLMVIPESRLKSEVLKARRTELLAKAVAVRSNDPYHSFGVSSSAFTTEDYLREQGADTNDPNTRELLAICETLTTFEAKYLNAVPSEAEAAEALPHLVRLREVIASLQSTPGVAEYARGVMCSVAETILKKSLPKTAELFRLARLIILEGAGDPVPQFDPKYHGKFDLPSWGSPSPRIEAAQGLANMLWTYGLDDKEVLEGFLRLANDPVPAVRYQVANGLISLYKHGAKQEFWNIQSQMAEHETTPGVMLGLVTSVGRVAGSAPEETMNMVALMLKRLPKTERSELRRSLINVAAGLYIAQGTKAADRELRRFERNPIRYHAELDDAVTTASQYFSMRHSEQMRSRVTQLWTRTLEASYAALQKLQHRDARTLRVREKQSFSGLLRIIDEIATRMFFALDIDPQFRQEERGLRRHEQRQLYLEAKPVLQLIAIPPTGLHTHILPAHTAHYLMQMLTGVLQYDAPQVIVFAAGVCAAGGHSSYQYDSLAIADLTTFVERVFADHREVLRDRVAAEALGSLLDMFVAAGWPQAMQLTYKLDQMVR